MRIANLDCEHDAAAIERGVRRHAGIVDLKLYFTSFSSHHVALGELTLADAAMSGIQGGAGWNSGCVSPR